MLESRLDCFWGHNTYSNLFSPTDADRHPTENIACEPLANKLLGAEISYLGKWVYINGNFDGHTSWSPPPPLCLAWESEKLATDLCCETYALPHRVRTRVLDPNTWADSISEPLPCFLSVCLSTYDVNNSFNRLLSLKNPSQCASWTCIQDL